MHTILPTLEETQRGSDHPRQTINLFRTKMKNKTKYIRIIKKGQRSGGRVAGANQRNEEAGREGGGGRTGRVAVAALVVALASKDLL
jgi:hypothetical protein